jgi:hypothetical protein
MDLIEHFKIEELKERLEFDMAAEAAGWNKKKSESTTSSKATKVKAAVDAPVATVWTW